MRSPTITVLQAGLRMRDTLPSPFARDPLTPMSTYLEPGWIERFAELWEQLGPETRTAIDGLLGDEWSYHSKRIMDFGCGAGRTLKHFIPEAESAAGEVWGADIDAASVDLLNETVCPPLRVIKSDYLPPLPLETGSFDLIWSISVFTHLTDNSLPWLCELHRLLAPGGLLIATYMGRWTSELLAGEPWDEDRVGMNVLRHNHPAADGAPLTMISDWWLREHWGRAFDVVTIEPNIHNQSWALLRKRDVDICVADLERPADDPREIAALRHNLVQAQREIEAVTQRGADALAGQAAASEQARAAAVEQARDEFESSLSWALTRPLRAARRAAGVYRARHRSA
jgi:SAM-dependent methyltransferase